MLHTLDQISNAELGNIKKRNDFYAVNLFVNSEKDGSVPFYFQTPKMKLSSTLVKGQSSIEVDCDNETFIKHVESVDQYMLDIVSKEGGLVSQPRNIRFFPRDWADVICFSIKHDEVEGVS